MNLRKLHDDITAVVANGLHYIEQSNYINSLKTAAEVQAALDGAVDRYANDPKFAARVKTMVAAIMKRVAAETSPAPEGEFREDAERFRWLLEQPPSVRDAVLSPPIPPEKLESPETWNDFVRAAIDNARRPQERR